jgi:hypothetical protein
MMEAVSISETSVNFYKTTLRNIPEAEYDIVVVESWNFASIKFDLSFVCSRLFGTGTKVKFDIFDWNSLNDLGYNTTGFEEGHDFPYMPTCLSLLYWTPNKLSQRESFSVCVSHCACMTSYLEKKSIALPRGITTSLYWYSHLHRFSTSSKKGEIKILKQRDLLVELIWIRGRVAENNLY